MSIFLSAGHSNTDPGAVAHGRREADIAVEFRNITSFYMMRAKVDHSLDGVGTMNLPLNFAAAEARKHKTALEFHCNASDNKSATGCEVLCGPKNTALAAEISAALAEALGIRNRGAKPEGSGQHKRLAFIQSGGLIVELFFLSNWNDLARYDARKWLAARAVAQILIDRA